MVSRHIVSNSFQGRVHKRIMFNSYNNIFKFHQNTNHYFLQPTHFTAWRFWTKHLCDDSQPSRPQKMVQWRKKCYFRRSLNILSLQWFNENNELSFAPFKLQLSSTKNTISPPHTHRLPVSIQACCHDSPQTCTQLSNPLYKIKLHIIFIQPKHTPPHSLTHL